MAPPEGHPRLRAALAEHLGRVRGAVASPATTLATAGYAGGLRIVLDVLAARGVRRVGLEDPGYAFGRRPSAAQAWRSSPSGRTRTVSTPRPCAAPIRMPRSSRPRTRTRSAPCSRRSAAPAARLGARARRLVIEDDYDAEFRYDRGPVGALQGLAPERVILAGTASKLLAPALRLGWLVAPGGLVQPLREAALVQEHGGPVLDQVALALLFETGAIDRHVRAGRARYRARRAALLAALAERLPGCPVGGIDAGLTVWMGLPDNVDEDAFAAEAERRGVRVHTLASSRIARAEPRGLVLGYANASERELREAAEVLAEALAAVRS